ncbi:MAG: hypothetical protein AAGH64_09040 [Planctomycetota bacterium]
MYKLAAAAILAASGTALAQVPFIETFDTDAAGFRDGPGNPATFNVGAIDSQTVDNANGFFAPFPGGPAFATIFRVDDNSSGGAFTGDYFSNDIRQISFDVTVNNSFGPGEVGPFGLSIRLAGANPATGLSPASVTVGPGPNTVTFDLSLANLSQSNPGAGVSDLDIFRNVQDIQITAIRLPFSPATGSVSFTLDNFAIGVPAPGAAGLLAVAGLAATRRRR